MKERFFQKISAAAHERGCRMWTGAISDKGYGRFNVGGKNERAHKVAWTLRFGAIPDGAHVLHSCDNRACVNPEHLFLGNNQDNIIDRVTKGRSHRPNGTQNGRAKLSPEQVAMIRRAQFKTNTDLARQLGVTRKAVAFVREGRTWRPD